MYFWKSTIQTIGKSLIASIIGLSVLSAAVASDYDDARKAMRNQEWQRALELFERAEEQPDRNADAAIYWQAHIWSQLENERNAMRMIRKLERQYPDSKWADDARALRVELSDTTDLAAQLQDSELMDDELRLYALGQLVHRDPDRAVPLIMRLIENSDQERVKRHALQLLAMANQEASNAMVLKLAKGSDGLEMQIEAIRALAVSGSAQIGSLFEEIYEETQSAEVKRAVIEAAIPSGNTQFLQKLLAEETNNEVRSRIISTLGVLGETEQLHQYYNTSSSANERQEIAHALAIAGDAEGLLKIYRKETDPRLRTDLARSMAITGDSRVVDFFREVAQSSNDEQELLAMLNALVILGDGSNLARDIALQSDNPRVQHKAIEVIGIQGDITQISQMYADTQDSEVKRALLKAFVISGASDAVLEALAHEEDPELRLELIRTVGITGGNNASQVLTDQYPDASAEEKKAIAQALMIAGDARGLIALAKQESDPEARRQLVRVLTTMGGPDVDDALFELLEDNQ